jgi:hypothetical protein
VYWHHGIDRGDGTVIHYDGSPRRPNGTVSLMSLDSFSRGHRVDVVSSCPPELADEVVERAESRIGEASYDLVRNNCEHFATWCSSGRHDSRQVRAVINTVATAAAVAWVAASMLRRGRHDTPKA